MHEAAFAQAALPAPARVLGLTLRPFSLGHELWLIREQNTLALNADPASLGKLMTALPQAVLCCAQTHLENSGRWDLLALPKFLIWSWEIRKFNLAQELIKFRDYRKSGSTAFPDEPADSTEGKRRSLGQPLLLAFHHYIINLGSAEWSQYGKSPWDYPYGLAQMRYSAAAELDGRLKIKNAAEMAEDKAMKEWEAKHPESTLVMNPKNA